MAAQSHSIRTRTSFSLRSAYHMRTEVCDTSGSRFGNAEGQETGRCGFRGEEVAGGDVLWVRYCCTCGWFQSFSSADLTSRDVGAHVLGLARKIGPLTSQGLPYESRPKLDCATTELTLVSRTRRSVCSRASCPAGGRSARILFFDLEKRATLGVMRFGQPCQHGVQR